jgi:hypothetical protein
MFLHRLPPSPDLAAVPRAPWRVSHFLGKEVPLASRSAHEPCLESRVSQPHGGNTAGITDTKNCKITNRK